MKKGFTILEVLVSLVMISVLVVSIFPLIGWLNARSAVYRYDSEAAVVLQEGTEAIYNYFLGLTNWQTYSNTDHYLVVDVSSGQKKWELIEGGRRNVGVRFTQWHKIVPVCRNQTNGDILWTGTGSGKSIDCSDPDTMDSSSRMVYSYVSWKESGAIKEINSELLVVKL